MKLLGRILANPVVRAEVKRKYVNGPPGDAGAMFFRVTSRAGPR